MTDSFDKITDAALILGLILMFTFMVSTPKYNSSIVPLWRPYAFGIGSILLILGTMICLIK